MCIFFDPVIVPLGIYAIKILPYKCSKEIYTNIITETFLTVKK